MTNADTVNLAVKDIIKDPRNPFTGNLLDGHEKNKGVEILFSEEIDTSVNNGNKFMPGEWYTVKDDPYVLGNWEYLGFH